MIVVEAFSRAVTVRVQESAVRQVQERAFTVAPGRRYLEDNATFSCHEQCLLSSLCAL